MHISSRDLLLDFLFPRKSLSGAIGEWVTAEERERLRRFTPVRLHHDRLRAMGVHAIDTLVAAGEYKASPLLRRIVHQVKYKRIRALSGECAELLVRASSLIEFASASALVPTPLHWTRRFSRGFNQSRLLADVLAAKLSVRVCDHLRRTRATGSQVQRDKDERRTALVDAFAWTVNDVPRHAVLIDDVATTGSTVEECARVLREHGAERVDALVLALG